MRTAILGAAVLAASAFAMPLSAQESADEKLAALGDSYQDYQLAQYGFVEGEGGGLRLLGGESGCGRGAEACGEEGATVHGALIVTAQMCGDA